MAAFTTRESGFIIITAQKLATDLVTCGNVKKEKKKTLQLIEYLSNFMNRRDK